MRAPISILPTTDAGRWAAGLAAAAVALVAAGPVVPRGAALGFACGLAGGLVALTAVVRERERALAVVAALVPFAIAVAFLLAQAIG